MSPWPEARTAMLRRLVAEGLSGAAIGAAMDLTKNAVVGKCRRLHIRLQGDNNGGGCRTGQVLKPKPPVVRKRKPVAEPEVVLVVPPTPPARTCKWIEGSGRPWQYCDAPVWRGAWCRDHYARVYQRHREPV